MTNSQNIQCHAIIHAAAAGGANAVPIPALTAVLVGMALGLAAIFGDSITESAATVPVGLVEVTGWALAAKFDRKSSGLVA